MGDLDKLRSVIDKTIRAAVAVALIEFAGFDAAKARKCAAIMKIRMQPFYGA
jgi:hypothetical protein